MPDWRENLRANRRQIARDLMSTDNYWYYSPLSYAQYRITLPLMKEHLRGRLIDLGCGNQPFRRYVEGQVACYDTLDLSAGAAHLTYLGDIQDMAMVPSRSYDSAICMEVLEHVPDPVQAIREAYRVLTPGGVLIVSVPHLSRLHDVPCDFYRYTSFGLRYLLGQAGFSVICLRPRGGLISFLGHQISTVLLAWCWNWTPTRVITWVLNKWLITMACFAVDRLLSSDREFPAGYVAVAVKPALGAETIPSPELDFVHE